MEQRAATRRDISFILTTQVVYELTRTESTDLTVHLVSYALFNYSAAHFLPAAGLDGEEIAPSRETERYQDVAAE